jgi:hypothetical protein
MRPAYEVTEREGKSILALDQLYDRLAKLRPGETLQIEGTGFAVLSK